MSESPIENPVNNRGITALIVKGYKAIADEINVEIAPLTIFAGANSSGKSSVMQPLLLMKQTLQATYDPGALLLNVPHVKFTSAKQLFNKNSNGQVNEFDVGIELDKDIKLICTFSKIDGKPIDLPKMKFGNIDFVEMTTGQIVLEDEDDASIILAKINQAIPARNNFMSKEIFLLEFKKGLFISLKFNRRRCFLVGTMSARKENQSKNIITIDAIITLCEI